MSKAMNKISSDSRNLNIRYDLPDEIWDKVPAIYESMDGWLGFGDGSNGQKGIPFWFSYNYEDKHISASVEPSGLQFFATNIDEQEWETWLKKVKEIATKTLGFKVGEIELGEVGYEIEWL